MTQENIDSIRQLVIDQATAFLKDAGEFYPFGVAIDKNDELRPVGIYIDDEQPESGTVIDRLGEALWKGIEQGDYRMVGMGIDVYLPDDSPAGKTSAIEIRVLNEDLFIRYYLPYRLDASNNPVYGEIIVEENES